MCSGVAAAYLKQSNRTLGLFVPTQKPDRADIPSTPDVLALVKDYKGDAAVAAGEAFDPSPTNIESCTARLPRLAASKTAFLTKKTRGNTVQLQMSLHFGDEKSLMNRATAGSFAGDLLMRGTKTKTRQTDQRRIRPPESARRRGWQSNRRERYRRNQPRKSACSDEVSRRNPARPCLPGQRIRRTETGTACQH
ncbi:MAG: hypothetical protein U0Y68_12065 [Blastocatellia bacterium]